jgi:hypothetical protein
MSDECPIDHRYRLLAPHFSEHEVRMWAAVEPASYGKGGITALATLSASAPVSNPPRPGRTSNQGPTLPVARRLRAVIPAPLLILI